MELIPLYVFIFIAIYAQVFLTMVLLENWEAIFEKNTNDSDLPYYPSVVIAVPCWNEGKTVDKTLSSLLALNYPKDKLSIWAIDDGSTDDTWKILQKYKNNSQVEIRQKENGGKHTAVNYVIENSNSEIFGCLDADSYVFPETLKNMIKSFNKDPEIMALTPMMIVDSPKNILQAMQSVEYTIGLLIRRIFTMLNAVHVTPGPFSLFRTEVFQKIGIYKKAHNTEDLEIALRMHKHHMKISNALDAYVETKTPDSIKVLYKQRVRWQQGFLLNSIDYKSLVFNPKYGNIGMFTIPFSWFGIISIIYLFLYSLWGLAFLFIDKYKILIATDFSVNLPNVYNVIESIYFNSNTVLLLSVPLAVSGITFILISNLLNKKRMNFLHFLYFIFLWSFLVPLWMTKSMFNIIFKKKASWR